MNNEFRTFYHGLPFEVKGALADAFKVHYSTIMRWIGIEDDRLTSNRARNILKERGFTLPDFKPKEVA